MKWGPGAIDSEASCVASRIFPAFRVDEPALFSVFYPRFLNFSPMRHVACHQCTYSSRGQISGLSQHRRNEQNTRLIQRLRVPVHQGEIAHNSPVFALPRCLRVPSTTVAAVFRRQFMQRKARVEEAQKQQQARKDKLERDFSSMYAKRLKANNNKADEKDR